MLTLATMGVRNRGKGGGGGGGGKGGGKGGGGSKDNTALYAGIAVLCLAGVVWLAAGGPIARRPFCAPAALPSSVALDVPAWPRESAQC